MHAEPDNQPLRGHLGRRPGSLSADGSRARRPGSAVAGAGVAVLLGAALLAGCSGGGSTPAATANATVAVRSSGSGSVGTTDCLVGTWGVSAEQEFVQMGLDTLTDGSVTATGGTIRVVFAADHTYTFRYDKVRLSVGGGAGSASVDGPVNGTWTLEGDRLTTTVGTSKIAVTVNVAGVTITPSRSLNEALKSGMPSSARVNCAAGKLVTTVTAGAAAGRQVTFAAG